MFVFDTYALVEIIRGNKNYLKYIDADIIINTFILTELAYVLIRDYGDDIALKYVEKYKKYVKSVSSELVLNAMEFRYKNRKKKMSMVDCISYFMAKEMGIRFLTGDKEFEKLEDVEFVK